MSPFEKTPPPEENPPAGGLPPEEPVAPEGFQPFSAEPSESETNPPVEDALPAEFAMPEDFQPRPETATLNRARRRRAQRTFAIPEDEQRSALLTRLARRAFPSFEFFLFSLLCGAILGAGFLLDSQSLLLLGILLAPLMTPWVGLALASTTGSWRFFFQALGGLLVSAILIFLTGLIAGVAVRLWLPLPLVQANVHSRLWWPNLFVVVLGAVLLVLSFVRSEEKPILPSIMLTYELYLPLSAGGFGLGAGLARIWPDGLLVYLAHLALATLFSVIMLAILKFRPLKITGYILGAAVTLAALAAAIFLSGAPSHILPPSSTRTPTVTATLKPVPSPITIPTLTPTHPLPTATSTPRITPSVTSTETITPTPTPFYARIDNKEDIGTVVRSEPGYQSSIVVSLLNGWLVEILPEREVKDGVTWVHIYVPDMDVEGWVQESVLATATPPPG